MKGRAYHWSDHWNDFPVCMRRFATHIGPTDARVLLLGPTGSGKGYLARILHELSSRGGGPFVQENCGAFTESLAGPTLFGHMRGAFTGATESKPGLVETAAGGTLFLDEFGALPHGVQAMLLTFLDTGEFRRVGSTTVREADVRVIAATNRNLGMAMAEGVFREDLVARLSFRYEVPPLRKRQREIAGIVSRSLRTNREETGVGKELTEDALYRLQNHDWPRNIRELLSVLSYCMIFATDGLIPLDLVEEAIQNQQIGAKQTSTWGVAGDARNATDEEKLRALCEALDVTNGDMSKAARLLQIDRTTVYLWACLDPAEPPTIPEAQSVPQEELGEPPHMLALAQEIPGFAAVLGEMAYSTAEALALPEVRANVLAAMRASDRVEHALILGEYLGSGDGVGLLHAAAHALGVTESEFKRKVVALPALELVVPIRDQRLVWTGSANIGVAGSLDSDATEFTIHEASGVRRDAVSIPQLMEYDAFFHIRPQEGFGTRIDRQADVPGLVIQDPEDGEQAVIVTLTAEGGATRAVDLGQFDDDVEFRAALADLFGRAAGGSGGGALADALWRHLLQSQVELVV